MSTSSQRPSRRRGWVNTHRKDHLPPRPKFHTLLRVKQGCGVVAAVTLPAHKSAHANTHRYKVVVHDMGAHRKCRQAGTATAALRTRMRAQAHTLVRTHTDIHTGTHAHTHTHVHTHSRLCGARHAPARTLTFHVLHHTSNTHLRHSRNAHMPTLAPPPPQEAAWHPAAWPHNDACSEAAESQPLRCPPLACSNPHHEDPPHRSIHTHRSVSSLRCKWSRPSIPWPTGFSEPSSPRCARAL